MEVSVKPSEKPAAAESKVAEGETPQRPDNVPEKFWNAETGQVNTEDLLKSYAEIEGRMRSGAATKEEPKGGDDLTIREAPKATVGSALKEVYESFQTEGGKLTEAALTKIAEAGLSRDDVETYIAGQTSKSAARAQVAYGAAGDKEQYKAITTWAAKTLPKAEVEAFNNVVKSAEASVVELAVAGLRSKYVAANGQEASERIGGNKTADSGDVFKTRAEFSQIAGTYKYRNDPTFRAEVDAKVSRSRANWT